MIPTILIIVAILVAFLVIGCLFVMGIIYSLNVWDHIKHYWLLRKVSSGKNVSILEIDGLTTAIVPLGRQLYFVSYRPEETMFTSPNGEYSYKKHSLTAGRTRAVLQKASGDLSRGVLSASSYLIECTRFNRNSYQECLSFLSDAHKLAQL